MSDFLYRFREPLSLANVIAAVLFLAYGAKFAGPMPKNLIAQSPPLEVTLAAPDVEPAPEAPPRQAVKPRAVPARSPAPPRLSAPVRRAPVVAAPDALAEEDVPPPPASVVSAAPTTPADAVATVQAARAADSRRDAETRYVANIRAYLQSTKRYPTGREVSLLRPTGTTVVRFTVRRSGGLLDAEVETSAGNMLLDRAALTAVRRGVYPPFPDDAWPGKTQHRFTVDLDFVARD